MPNVYDSTSIQVLLIPWSDGLSLIKHVCNSQLVCTVLITIVNMRTQTWTHRERNEYELVKSCVLRHLQKLKTRLFYLFYDIIANYRLITEKEPNALLMNWWQGSESRFAPCSFSLPDTIWNFKDLHPKANPKYPPMSVSTIFSRLHWIVKSWR
jgi:hypothetical protein